jgi:hypothetical protein
MKRPFPHAKPSGRAGQGLGATSNPEHSIAAVHAPTRYSATGAPFYNTGSLFAQGRTAVRINKTAMQAGATNARNH